MAEKDLVQVTDHHGIRRSIIYTIESIVSQMYVHAPPKVDGEDCAAALIVQADDKAAEAKWLIERSGSDGHGHDLFTIRSLGTMAFACHLDTAKDGDVVVDGVNESQWKLINKGDGHFAISAAVDGEDVLVWVEDAEQKTIVLHHEGSSSTKESEHFRLYALRGVG